PRARTIRRKQPPVLAAVDSAGADRPASGRRLDAGGGHPDVVVDARGLSLLKDGREVRREVGLLVHHRPGVVDYEQEVDLGLGVLDEAIGLIRLARAVPLEA